MGSSATVAAFCVAFIVAMTNVLYGVAGQRIDCKAAICDRAVYEPVCGRDGNSYGNDCIARCYFAVNNIDKQLPRGLCKARGRSSRGTTSTPSSPREYQPGRRSTASPAGSCSCPTTYAPVCDASNRAHDNACLARCNSAPLPYKDGECTSQGCPCGTIFKPVCGENGFTYGNACEAGCAKIAVASQGPCPNVPSIVCDPLDSTAACFADPCGVVDSSPCKGQAGYQCMSNYCGKPTTYLGHRVAGPCSAIYVHIATLTIAPECREVPFITCGRTDPGATCTADPCVVNPSPCKTDDATRCLPNYCGNPTSYKGYTIWAPCSAVYVDASTLAIVSRCNPGVCKCPALVSPVCGSDGKTYSSPCKASCTGRVKSWTPRACNSCAKVTPSFAPVCGADRRTYQNKQAANCQGMQAAYRGICHLCPLFKQCAKVRKAPVCGKNGRTYCHACAAKYKGVKVASKGVCRGAKCLPQGSACLLAKPKCCGGLSCKKGPVLRVGTCSSVPRPKG